MVMIMFTNGVGCYYDNQSVCQWSEWVGIAKTIMQLKL